MAGLFILLVAAATAQGQTYQVLHTFTGGADGGSPFAGLTQDSAGNFYGTTTYGGQVTSTCPDGCGVVFKLAHSGEGWVLTPIYTFQGGEDGANPLAAVVIASDGTLYGTTGAGGGSGCPSYFYGGNGCGTVFRLQPQPRACASFHCPWTETVLYRFTGGSDGATPGYGNLLFDQAGNLYDAATYGGLDGRYCSTGCGVVYELTHSSQGWTENVLYSFTSGDDGATPFSGLIFDSAGNLYGTNYFGTVYELTPSQSGWSEQTLYNLGFSEPYGGVVFDSAGNLFGGDQFGGENGGGSVYELTPGNSGWTYNLLFSCNYGQGPEDSLVLDSSGNIYGTSYSNDPPSFYGEVFELSPANGGWNINYLHAFDYDDGAIPVGAVVRDSTGTLFGTTAGGGNNGCDFGCGVIWEITP
ncbi:MAG: choice-of-anchor tandem repeat GloVer-containing protein [Candidatus Korobacteraceae bacterium]